MAAAINSQLICKWRLESASHLEVQIEDRSGQGIVGTVFNTLTQTSWPNSHQFRVEDAGGHLSNPFLLDQSSFNRCVWKGPVGEYEEARSFRNSPEGFVFVAANLKTQEIRGELTQQGPGSDFEDPLAETGMIRYYGDMTEEIVKIWPAVRADGAVVQLIRFGDDLKYSLIRPLEATIEAPLPPPAGMSVNDLIARLTTLQCIVGDDNVVHFKRRDPEIESIQSIMDSECIVDKTNWVVTLVNNTSRSESGSDIGTAKTWGGHAVIIIEAINFKNDGYQTWKADALPSKNDPLKLRVRFEREMPSDLLAYKTFHGNKTWVRAKELVEQMMNHISSEMTRYERGENIGKFDPLVGAGSSSRDTYNCIEWARARLSLARIAVNTGFSDNLLITPASISGTKIGTAQKVATTVGSVGGSFLGGAMIGGACGFTLGIAGGPVCVITMVVGMAAGALIGGLEGIGKLIDNNPSPEAGKKKERDKRI